ncbi:hypothetical protein RSM1_11270 [Methylobacterium radiotolerans]|nr:hypothetical protein RSM1_11270 [Methylobacterium radiotolerans]
MQTVPVHPRGHLPPIDPLEAGKGLLIGQSEINLSMVARQIDRGNSQAGRKIFTENQSWMSDLVELIPEVAWQARMIAS